MLQPSQSGSGLKPLESVDIWDTSRKMKIFREGTDEQASNIMDWVYSKTYKPLLAALMKRGFSKEEAEDLCNVAFVTLWLSRRQLRLDGSPYNYLLTVAWRAGAKQQNRSKREQTVSLTMWPGQDESNEQRDIQDTRPSPEIVVIAEEMRSPIISDLDRLYADRAEMMPSGKPKAPGQANALHSIFWMVASSDDEWECRPGLNAAVTAFFYRDYPTNPRRTSYAINWLNSLFARAREVNCCVDVEAVLIEPLTRDLYRPDLSQLARKFGTPPLPIQ